MMRVRSCQAGALTWTSSPVGKFINRGEVFQVAPNFIAHSTKQGQAFALCALKSCRVQTPCECALFGNTGQLSLALLQTVNT
jgi:hypothetical protein